MRLFGGEVDLAQAVDEERGGVDDGGALAWLDAGVAEWNADELWVEVDGADEAGGRGPD